MSLYYLLIIRLLYSLFIMCYSLGLYILYYYYFYDYYMLYLFSCILVVSIVLLCFLTFLIDQLYLGVCIWLVCFVYTFFSFKISLQCYFLCLYIFLFMLCFIYLSLSFYLSIVCYIYYISGMNLPHLAAAHSKSISSWVKKKFAIESYWQHL